MKKILVPTDFSPTAERAFLYAIDLAKRSGAAVVLYHVYEPLESEFIDNLTRKRLYNEQMGQELQLQLERLCRKLVPEDSAVEVLPVLGRSPLIDNVLGYSEHHAIDLICMGTQGAGGLKRVLVGSNAANIIRQSDIPVLLIPEKFDWKVPEQIIYFTDCLAPDRAAFDSVIGLANLYGASITVAHFIRGTAGTTDLENESGFFKAYAQQLTADYPVQPIRFELIKTTSIVMALEQLHLQLPYDLLVMVRREKHFLQRLFVESFTKNMLYTSSQPLLVIPEETGNE